MLIGALDTEQFSYAYSATARAPERHIYSQQEEEQSHPSASSSLPFFPVFGPLFGHAAADTSLRGEEGWVWVSGWLPSSPNPTTLWAPSLFLVSHVIFLHISHFTFFFIFL